MYVCMCLYMCVLHMCFFCPIVSTGEFQFDVTSAVHISSSMIKRFLYHYPEPNIRIVWIETNEKVMREINKINIPDIRLV